ncbi:GumC family protein [Spongiimicrobium sp. 3-5]|uniref:GumC family protein n=1 Tax=Spongiimicrobium sp. 3-5 TaxID=3332596 RepID=UPI00397F4FEE
MSKISGSSLTGDISLKELITSYTKQWKWFVISILIALVLAFLKIRYSTPEYAAKAKIQVIEEKGSSPELGVFQDLKIFSGGKNKVEDEIEIINSRSNHIEVVKTLGINVKVIALGNILDSEVYHRSPVNIIFNVPDSIIHRSKFEFFIDLSTNTTFGYTEKEDKPVRVFSFGKNIPSPVGDIVITPNLQHLKSYDGGRFMVKIEPIELVAQHYQKKTIVTAAAEFSNIVNITLNDPIQQKALDILNSLVTIYNRNAIEDKKAIADKTSDFINDRIADIYTNLSTVDQSAEDFKTGRGITDIASEANINLNVGVANRQELLNTTTQLNIASSMKDIVDSQDGYDVLPSNIGLTDASIATTTAKYNQLVLERKRLLKSSNEKNPIIVNLDQQLSGLKRSMQSSLNSMTNNLNLQVNSLSSQVSQINSRIYSAPKNQRALRDITRQQQTTESLYLYLLQKREESQIAYASASPKSKVVDSAYNASATPVSPKKAIIYLASIILGLALPFSVIYVGQLLDNKIHNKTGLEKLVKNIPVLAELPKLSKKESKLILKDDRSVLAESLRILRTNLDYLMKSKNSKGKNNLIFITSSVSGEGKTFLSSNLSMVLASTNKKVLLIGADIRNPKLYTFFSNKNIDKFGTNYPGKDRKSSAVRSLDAGLTEYLYDHTISAADITNSMLVHNSTIDVIYSGKIPPNPAELLMGGRVKELLDEVSEKYDYVIVDTAPLMVVTDTLLISNYADHIIYVTRAGVTETKVIEFPLKLKKEGKLNGLCFVVNDVKEYDLGYGGKYGYGYGKTIKKWWKF